MVKWLLYGAAALGGYILYTSVVKTPLQTAITGMEPPPKP